MVNFNNSVFLNLQKLTTKGLVFVDLIMAWIYFLKTIFAPKQVPIRHIVLAYLLTLCLLFLGQWAQAQDEHKLESRTPGQCSALVSQKNKETNDLEKDKVQTEQNEKLVVDGMVQFYLNNHRPVFEAGAPGHLKDQAPMQLIWAEKIAGVQKTHPHLVAAIYHRIQTQMAQHQDTSEKIRKEHLEELQKQEKEILLNVCSRTQQVQDAIVLKIGKPCHEITRQDLQEITDLNLTAKGIRSLKEHDLFGLTQLSRIDLAFNELESLPERLFRDTSLLNGVELAGNQIRALPETIFHGVPLLVALSLRNNQLQELPELLFHKLENLHTLKLQGNELRSIHPIQFQGLKELTNLSLRSNEILEIAEDLFVDLTKLKVLDLCHNKIKELPLGVFQNLSELETLSIGSNQIKKLSFSLFQHLNQMQVLTYNKNPLDATESLALEKSLGSMGVVVVK